jgi:hypothetical protein
MLLEVVRMSKRLRAPAPVTMPAGRQSDALIVVVPKWALLRSVVTRALVTSDIMSVRTLMRARPSVKR